MADLLFLDFPETIEEILDGIRWFLSGWQTDAPPESGGGVPVMDWDVDQWRIYSAFRTQYGIDLNSASMHFWEFMGLVSTLGECAFTQVADIRGMELDGKMYPKLREKYRKLKKRYALDRTEEPETEEDIEATEEFLRLAGLR